MNLICWNARGLGNPRSFRELRRLIAEKDPTLFFLSETKMRATKCKLWKSILRFTGCFMVDCKGKSGGLILFWKNLADVSIKSYSMGHIDCVIQESGNLWRFTGFYGQPDASLRHFSWDLLKRLKSLRELDGIPWLVGGDFNEICYESEKLGGNRRPIPQMQAFRDTLEVCELQDIFCHGDAFTWVNRRRTENLVFERLDKFEGSLNWRLLYPTAHASSMEFFHSDHRPICMKLTSAHSQGSAKKAFSRTTFRFERFWLTEEDCGEIVQMGWGEGNHSIPLPTRILQCKESLQTWARAKFQNIPKRLKEKRSLLNGLRTSKK
ncbi:uncharacterized protein [Primulina eburnea]|uniref:uncharacterized protein n=1 Tax=Primulina eburnea TaxID=1245227 RepID=UPI003C6C6AD3